MKIMLTVLLLTTISGSTVKTLGQAIKVTKINYDFDGKKLIPPNASLTQLKPGEFYQVVVHNINGNLYKVSVNARDTSTSAAIQMPTFTSLDIAGITSAIAGINAGTTSISMLDDKFNLLKGGGAGAAEGKKSLTTETGLKMLEYKMKLNEFLSSLIVIKSRIDSLQLQICRYELNQLITVPMPSINLDVDRAVSTIFRFKVDIDLLQKEIIGSQQDYQFFSGIEKVSAAKEKDSKLASADKMIADAYALLLSGSADLQVGLSAEKIKELLAAAIHVGNNSSRDYVSLPFQFRNDQAKMTLTIEPRKPEYGLNTYKDELHFPLMRKAYAGVGISFYTSKLHDEAYSTLGTPVNDSVTSYEIKPEHFAKAEVGITALLRLGSKVGDAYGKWGYHFSIGPGISIANTLKPRLLTGGGLSFGNNHMITIDAGAIVGYVNVLSSVVDLNNTTLAAPAASLTVSRLKTAAFVSVGYLFRF